MRKAMIGCLAVLAIELLAWASNDPWKDKPYQQWDQKDVQRVLSSSPWTKTVQVEAKWAPNQSAPQQPNSPQSSPSTSAGSSGSSATRPGGGLGGAGSSPSSQPATGGGGIAASDSAAPEAAFAVRWLSARTMREALVRSAVLAGSMTQADADKNLAQPVDTYQVFISGPQMTPFESAEETSLKQGAVLTTKKGKQKIEASKVEIQRGTDGKTVRGVVISFPKKTSTGEATIASDEKGADFALSNAGLSIKTSFDFSKMNDAQGRDI
jgi:hypothetical protein